MWYTQLTEQLARSVCKGNEDAAEQFVRNLLYLFEKHILKDEEPEPMMIFGFIKDLYKFRKSTKSHNVLLSEFAEECFGLLIVHYKNADDYLVYCSDFLNLIRDKRISNALNVFAEVQQLKYEFLTGRRKSSKIIPFLELTPFTQTTDFKQYHAKDNLPSVIFTEILNRFERDQFKKLDNRVRVDLNEFIFILNELLIETENPVELCSDLLDFLQPFVIVDERFDAFILSIYEYTKQFYEPELSQRPVTKEIKEKKISFWSSFFLDDSDCSDSEHNSIPQSSQNQSKLRVIRPLLNPDLFQICNQLETYIVKNQKYVSFFVTDKRCTNTNTNAIAAVMAQIKTGQLSKVDSILDELKNIKLTNPKDELLDIIESIKKNHGDPYQLKLQSRPSETTEEFTVLVL